MISESAFRCLPGDPLTQFSRT